MHVNYNKIPLKALGLAGTAKSADSKQGDGEKKKRKVKRVGEWGEDYKEEKDGEHLTYAF